MESLVVYASSLPKFEVWQWLLGTAVTVLLGYLTYRGGKIQARVSEEGVEQTSRVDEQQSALEAWKELNQPLREEIERLGAALSRERSERLETEKQHAKDQRGMAEQLVALNKQVTEQAAQIMAQAEQIRHWKRLAGTIARFAAQMRDEVLRLGGSVPATPEEMLLIQSVNVDDDE